MGSRWKKQKLTKCKTKGEADHSIDRRPDVTPQIALPSKEKVPNRNKTHSSINLNNFYSTCASAVETLAFWHEVSLKHIRKADKVEENFKPNFNSFCTSLPTAEAHALCGVKFIGLKKLLVLFRLVTFPFAERAICGVTSSQRSMECMVCLSLLLEGETTIIYTVLHNFSRSVTFTYNSLCTQVVPCTTYAESNFELWMPVFHLHLARPRPAPFRRAALRPAPPRPATPRPATPRPATPRHATPRHATPRHATPRHAPPRHATPRPATPRPTTPRHAPPRRATPRRATAHRADCQDILCSILF